MSQKPEAIVDREVEWASLTRFVERQQRLGLVYGPRRVGKSFLIGAIAAAHDAPVYQAITGVETTQLADFGRSLGEWLGAGALQLADWGDALERLARVDVPFLVIDELPYLIEGSPDLPSRLQRYVDSNHGPALILSGSALSVMSDLVAPKAPLYGRAQTVVVPTSFAGPDVAALWGHPRPIACLWVDTVLGGLPGYRPSVAPPGRSLDRWIREEILAAGSPFLDMAEASLADVTDPHPLRGHYRAIIGAIAAGEHAFASIARTAGMESTALSRPLSALQRAGLVAKVPDPLRQRRARYQLADPHLAFWLNVIAPNRAHLQAGRAAEVWGRLKEATWPPQMLGPRWEAVARRHVEAGRIASLPAPEVTGTTVVSDRVAKRTHEVDIVCSSGGEVTALGEAKLRRLGPGDLERLERLRALIEAPAAKLILASVAGNDLPPESAERPDVLTVSPADVYET